MPRAEKTVGVRVETGAYVACFAEWEDMPNILKNKNGVICPAFKFVFEIEDMDGQEAFAGATLNKTLWYKIGKEGQVQIGAKAFKVIEALEGGEEFDNGDESSEFDDLIGNLVVLHVMGAADDNSFPEITRVDAYNEEDDPPKRKKKSPPARRSKSDKTPPKRGESKPKSDPDPDPSDDDDDATPGDSVGGDGGKYNFDDD